MTRKTALTSRLLFTFMVATATASGCNTTIIYQAMPMESGEESTTDQDETTDDPESETTGDVEHDTSGTGVDVAPSSSGTTADESTSTGAGESTGAIDMTTGTTGDESGTTDDPCTSGEESTGAPLKPLGISCTADDECESGACVFAGYGVPRCSIACTLNTLDDCAVQGYPGLCSWTGEAHWCGGWVPELSAHFLAGADYQSGPTPAAEGDRHAYLLPATEAAVTVQVDGAVSWTVYGADTKTLVFPQDGGTSVDLQPAGADYHHWIVITSNTDAAYSLTIADNL
ncbi:hypothetical protein [Nannocystis pusilla]|uniref:hypothetical protein n=1 Tax=Nannocystis pusilla TaxID=889268 RepID=UPI003DA4029F